MIPPEIIDELVQLKLEVIEATLICSDAIKIQAEKYRLDKGLLSKIITAVALEKLEELEDQTAELSTMLAEIGKP